MCDQLNGRLTTIQKFGYVFSKNLMNSLYRPPKDMDQTFHTLIHAGAKTEIEELAGVRKELGKLLGKEFVN